MVRRLAMKRMHSTFSSANPEARRDRNTGSPGANPQLTSCQFLREDITPRLLSGSSKGRGDFSRGLSSPSNTLPRRLFPRLRLAQRKVKDRKLEFVILFCLWMCAGVVWGEPPAYRRDEDKDQSKPWYKLEGHAFPPDDASHYFAGELIRADHLERRFTIRHDRGDEQKRGDWDLPVSAMLLPYAIVEHHGAFADLKDIPLGTHLHGNYFLGSTEDLDRVPKSSKNRSAADAAFSRCVRLQDDFSFYRSQGSLWRVASITNDDRVHLRLIHSDGKVADDTTIFELMPSTRYWLGDRSVTASALKLDQEVLFNVTWATLYGAGRITEMWLDESSRRLASDVQLTKHRQQMREQGIPARIDSVDNKRRIVTLTLMPVVDPSFFENFEPRMGTGISVAEDNLLMYDPQNDTRHGVIIETKNAKGILGRSTRQISVELDLLLEGYRPQRIVRVFSSGWKFQGLPREYLLFFR